MQDSRGAVEIGNDRLGPRSSVLLRASRSYLRSSPPGCSVILLAPTASGCSEGAYGLLPRSCTLSRSAREGWPLGDQRGGGALIDDVPADPSFVNRRTRPDLLMLCVRSSRAASGWLSPPSERTCAFDENPSTRPLPLDAIRARLENVRSTASPSPPLTGAYNREFLLARLAQEIEARSTGPHLSTRCSVDHFKAVNDHTATSRRRRPAVSRACLGAILTGDLLSLRRQEFLTVAEVRRRRAWMSRAHAQRVCERGSRRRRPMLCSASFASRSGALRVSASLLSARHRALRRQSRPHRSIRAMTDQPYDPRGAGRPPGRPAAPPAPRLSPPLFAPPRLRPELSAAAVRPPVPPPRGHLRRVPQPARAARGPLLPATYSETICDFAACRRCRAILRPARDDDDETRRAAAPPQDLARRRRHPVVCAGSPRSSSRG